MMDLTKIKQKLQELEAQKSGGSSKFKWSPTPGTHLIRIVPYIHNKDFPFLELYFYYKLKKMTVISPLSFGRPDPVQEFVDSLKETGDKEDWKTAINMQAKPRTYVPILVRGKEEEGVKFWGFGKQIYQELLKVIDDPDYGDITDPKHGRDITVEVVKTDKAWPDIMIRVKPKSSVMSDKKEILELIKEMPKIETLWKEPTYEDLKTMLENFLNNEESTDEPASTSKDAPQNLFDAELDETDIPTFVKPSEKKKQTSPTPDADEFDAIFNS